jgi:hypothetical protein
MSAIYPLSVHHRIDGQKPLDSMLRIPAELQDPVMALSPHERRDRAKVNEAAR